MGANHEIGKDSPRSAALLFPPVPRIVLERAPRRPSDLLVDIPVDGDACFLEEIIDESFRARRRSQ